MTKSIKTFRSTSAHKDTPHRASARNSLSQAIRRERARLMAIFGPHIPTKEQIEQAAAEIEAMPDSDRKEMLKAMLAKIAALSQILLAYLNE
jgi:uncharacterized protein (DUF1800 family)